jgi:hypothetical protein
MGFFQNLFNTTPAIEQPNTQHSLWGYMFNFEQKNKVLAKNYLEWYKTNPIVYTAISERAKAVSTCRFKIKTKDGELIDNELTNKLNKPNKYLSRNEFLYQLWTYKGIWGTAYLYPNKLRNSTPIQDIDFLNLPTNQIYFGENKAVNYKFDYILNLLKFDKKADDLKIWYAGLELSESKLLNKDLLMPFFDSTIFTNPYFSESKLESLQYPVSNIQSALESENTLLSNPGGIGMLVPDTKDASGVSIMLQDKEKEKIEKQLQQDYGTLQGQRNIRVLNSPTKYIDTMVDASKMKFSESVVQNALIIFGAYGLPKELLVALKEGSTFENQKTAYKNYIQTTAQTEADSLANSLNVMFPSVEGTLIADFSHLPIMQEDEKERADKDKTNAETMKINKEIYDDLLNRKLVTEQEYKLKLGL